MDCHIRNTKYDLVTENGTKLPQIFARCESHVTCSNHRFSTTEDAYRFYRCDEKNRSFLFAERFNQMLPFTGDMTELAYRMHNSYADNAYDIADYKYLIWEIAELTESGSLHLFPVTVHVVSEFPDENDFRNVKLTAKDVNGNELTTVTVRIDERA